MRKQCGGANKLVTAPQGNGAACMCRRRVVGKAQRTSPPSTRQAPPPSRGEKAHLMKGGKGARAGNCAAMQVASQNGQCDKELSREQAWYARAKRALATHVARRRSRVLAPPVSHSINCLCHCYAAQQGCHLAWARGRWHAAEGIDEGECGTKKRGTQWLSVRRGAGHLLACTTAAHCCQGASTRSSAAGSWQ